MQVRKIPCPIGGCGSGMSPVFPTRYQTVQHHLWQHHNIDVVKAHQIAAGLYDPPQPKSPHKKQTATKDPKQIEFEKKQLTLF